MTYKTAHTEEHWVFILENGSSHYFGNENLSENDALMMLTARETGEIQTAHTPDTWVFYPPNREAMKFEIGLFAETECWHTVEEIIKETDEV